MTTRVLRSQKGKPVPSKHLSPFTRGKVIGQHQAGHPLREISRNLKIPYTTVHDTCRKGEPGEKKGRGRPRKTTEEEDKKILDTDLEDRHQNHTDLRLKLELPISRNTIRHRLAEQHLRKWVAMDRTRLDDHIASERLFWAYEHRNWTKEIWRKRCIWGDKVTIERGGSKRQQWIFRYPKEKWIKDMVEASVCTAEQKVSQMMVGAFMGGRYGFFQPVYKDSESIGGGVTGRSIIRVFEPFLLPIWQQMVEESNGEPLYFIIDNAKTHLPVKRWLIENGVVLGYLPRYSPY